MTTRVYILVQAGIAACVSATVIFAAGYYDGPIHLIPQIAFLSIPSLVPFFILSALPGNRLIPSLICWMIVVAGWGYVVYLESQPYLGGGASLAPVAGLMACGGACLTAAAILIWRSLQLSR